MAANGTRQKIRADKAHEYSRTHRKDAVSLSSLMERESRAIKSPKEIESIPIDKTILQEIQKVNTPAPKKESSPIKTYTLAEFTEGVLSRQGKPIPKPVCGVNLISRWGKPITDPEVIDHISSKVYQNILGHDIL